MVTDQFYGNVISGSEIPDDVRPPVAVTDDSQINCLCSCFGSFLCRDLIVSSLGTHIITSCCLFKRRYVWFYPFYSFLGTAKDLGPRLCPDLIAFSRLIDILKQRDSSEAANRL